MSIERMKSIWLFAPRGRARRILDRLAATGLMHVSDCGLQQEGEHERLGVERVYPEAADLDRRVQLLRETFETLSAFHKTTREFLENFIPTPLEVEREEVERALDALDIESLHAEAKALDQRFRAAQAAREQAEEVLKALAQLEDMDGTVPGQRDQQHAAALLGIIAVDKLESLLHDERLVESFATHPRAQGKKTAVIQAACLASERSALEALLREYGCRIVEPEARTQTVTDYMAHRRDDVSTAAREVEAIQDEFKGLAKTHHREVETALGYWEERLRIANATGLLAESKRLTVLRGFVRENDMDSFKRRMAEDLPDADYEVTEPRPGDNVPISLRNAKFLAPAQFLLTMFGLPNYFTFDPTPYIVTSFLLFFGFCFGDAVYGILMVALGLVLARKYRNYPGTRSLFALLAIAGIPTFIVGALTGSWAGDLFSAKYMGKDNPLAWLCDNSFKFNMIQKSLVALAVALILGVVNQFLSLICLMIRNVRQGNARAAVFDGGFWLLVLPAVVLVAATLFTDVPKGLGNVVYGIAGIGAFGLILTQGRHEESVIGKAVVGVISLYGIVGSYGITAFIGDILSYSRLLALGLTTSIVGMCFNLIAGLAAEMAGGVRAVALILFVLVALLGHTMNFMISILGAFVHSARLIFVEFFGKFYQGDAVAYAPLGAWSGRIRVVDAKTIWNR